MQLSTGTKLAIMTCFVYKTISREGVGYLSISIGAVVLDLESVMCCLITDFLFKVLRQTFVLLTNDQVAQPVGVNRNKGMFNNLS